MKQSLYNINVKTISGEEQALSQYEGKVLLIVNVASKCGFTPQYSALQKVYEKYRDRGFCILAFPSDDFGGQEPGDNDEIKSFCETKFGVSFDLFSKTKVLGHDKSPLYRLFQESGLDPIGKKGPGPFIFRLVTGFIFNTRGEKRPEGDEVKWNFHKFLIDRKGFPVASFSSEVEPDSPLLTARLEEELEK
ncbi:MAG: glutathione peroxidase [Nitrospinota bacterium]